jgi:general secretion pathway protein N
MKWNGSAHLDAQDIASRLSTLRPMGSYRLSWQANAALSDNMSGPTIALSTLQGALRLSGKGEWIGSRLRFVGEASAAPEREAALANLLNIIGRRSGARTQP